MSVIPEGGPEQGPEGFVLRSGGDTATGAVGWSVGALGALAFCGVLVLLGFRAEDALGYGIVALVAAGVVAFLGTRALRQLRVVRRLGPGELLLPHWPLRLGDEVDVAFRRTVKRGASAASRVDARLECREIVRYQAGTDRRSASTSVYSEPLECRPDPRPDGVGAVIRVVVPPTAMHSLDLRNNDVRWHLHADLELTDGFTEDSDFTLTVVPELAAEVTR